MKKSASPLAKKKVRFGTSQNMSETYDVHSSQLGIRNSPIYQSLDNWHVIYKQIQPNDEFPIDRLRDFVRSNEFIQSQPFSIGFPYNIQLSPIKSAQTYSDLDTRTRHDKVIQHLDHIIFDTSEYRRLFACPKLIILLHHDKHLVEQYCNSLTTEDKMNMRPLTCVIFLKYNERTQNFSLLLHKIIRDKHQPAPLEPAPHSHDPQTTGGSRGVQSPRPVRVTTLPTEETPAVKSCPQHGLGALCILFSTVLLTGTTTFLNSLLTKQINDPHSNKDYTEDYMVNLFFCNLPATFIESILLYILKTCKPNCFARTPLERIPLLNDSIQRYDDICVSPNSRMECAILFYTLLCCGLLPYTAIKPLAILLHQPPKIDKNPLSNAICMMVITLGFTLIGLFLNRVRVYCQQKKKNEHDDNQKQYYYASHFSV